MSNTPLVILLADKLGIRSTFNTPLVILLAGKSGISASLSEYPAVTLPYLSTTTLV